MICIMCMHTNSVIILCTLYCHPVYTDNTTRDDMILYIYIRARIGISCGARASAPRGERDRRQTDRENFNGASLALGDYTAAVPGDVDSL